MKRAGCEAISGKSVLITGASGLIGRALSVHFAERGARLFITGRSETALEETAALCGGASFCPADLRRPDTLERLARTVSGELDRLDVLVNNAADITSKPFLDTSLDEIDSLIRTNVIGPLQLTRLLAPLLVRGCNPTVVNISSLAGFKPNPAQTVYSISKAGVNGMSDGLRAELEPRGIHVLNVALGSVGHGPDQVHPETVARKLARAIRNRQDDLYLSPLSKWLVRLYRLCPSLARAGGK